VTVVYSQIIYTLCVYFLTFGSDGSGTPNPEKLLSLSGAMDRHKPHPLFKKMMDREAMNRENTITTPGPSVKSDSPFRIDFQVST